MAEKKFPFDFMKVVENVTNDTAEVRVDVTNAGDIGGGTQYADGAAVATPTGNVVMGTDGTNVIALTTDASGDLQIDVKGALPAGTNNIGDVDIASIAAGNNNIGDVDVASIAAGDNNIGNVDIASALPAGTNNIGDVDIASIAAGDNNIGNVDIASIAAGDNNIGNVDLASSIPAGTNNIGDVDVLTVPRSLMGPAQPGTAIDSYTQVAINLAAGANQVLVSSAANKQIWVYSICISLNVAGTVSFQDEDDVAITGIMNLPAAGGFSHSPSGNFSMPIWKLGTDKDLEVDVVTAELDGWLTYALISV